MPLHTVATPPASRSSLESSLLPTVSQGISCAGLLGWLDVQGEGWVAGAAGWNLGRKAGVGLAVWLGPPPDEVWPSAPGEAPMQASHHLEACRRGREVPSVQGPRLAVLLGTEKRGLLGGSRYPSH